MKKSSIVSVLAAAVFVAGCGKKSPKEEGGTTKVSPVEAIAAETETEPSARIAVGDRAPAFALQDQNGQQVVLADLLQSHSQVALVFYRSAHW